MRFTITINGESVTLQGVTDGATIDLTPQSTPTVPTVPTVAEPTPTPTVDDVDDTETAPRSTVAPKGVNRSEGKRYGGRKPQSKAAAPKPQSKGKGKGQSPLQAAGMAKTRHGRYGSVKTAQSWLNAEMHAGDAERIKICEKVLRRNFRLSKTGTVSAKG